MLVRRRRPQLYLSADVTGWGLLSLPQHAQHAHSFLDMQASIVSCAGIVGMCKEHLGVALALKVPGT